MLSIKITVDALFGKFCHPVRKAVSIDEMQKMLHQKVAQVYREDLPDLTIAYNRLHDGNDPVISASAMRATLGL